MDKRKCQNKHCRKLAAKDRSICHSCKMKNYKESHPVEYAYQVLKNNAKRRNKEFTLTLDQFKKFCYETGVLHGRGRESTSYHIDRIDDTKGYTADNIQVLTNAQNVLKEHRRRKKIEFNYQYRIGYTIELSSYIQQNLNNSATF